MGQNLAKPLSLLAPAKINLALHVLGRRPDGYHDLDSIVTFANVGDWLTFSPAAEFSVSAGGPFAGQLPPPQENIIWRAWDEAAALAARHGRRLPPVSVRLTKNLPVASGIGGGSSNAATALRHFLRLAGIPDSGEEAWAAGLKLGADVPVCMRGVKCRMRGIGERVEQLSNFQLCHALLVNPMVEISTSAVFAKLGLDRGQAYGAPIADETNSSDWRNDLAAAALAIAPVIGDVLAKLESLPGVSRAFMSGSGGTCVALCDGPLDGRLYREACLDPAWWYARTTLM